MARKGFTVNKAGVRAIMKSPEVESELSKLARRGAQQANTAYTLPTEPRTIPYAVSVEKHKSVSVGRVYTHTKLGRLDNAKNNTLKKVRDGGL